uniref:HERV-H LTR-associating 2b, tandem duplicate 1 n=1 Tax=Pygocentrus nattereri TaxID=42514 RepID=A0AAR2LMN3_PYGNA
MHYRLTVLACSPTVNPFVSLLLSDVQITCLFSENCILPCSFKPTGGEEVQWFRQDAVVYSHPQSIDQPSEQLEGRTSMSTQQLALGNASLLLQRCGPQDRGRYRCRVVKAHIHSVNIDITRLSGFEEVKCSTQDVYPAPRVTWSTEPPTPSDKLRPLTRIMANKQGLYTVESKLKRLKGLSNFTYICTINSSYSARTWRTSLKETEINSAEGKDLTIPCKAPWIMQNFTLTWTFKLTTANETTVICTYDSETQLMSNQWKGRARVDGRTMQTGDASLQLLNPQSVEHTGTYTCIITGLQRRHEGQTVVNVTSPVRLKKISSSKSPEHHTV